jgi:nitrate reductase NapE component
MSIQDGTCCETFAALIVCIEPFLCVDAYMSIQGGTCETFAALTACIRPFLRVGHHLSSHVVARCETFVTHTACIWPFVRVGPRTYLQVTSPS